MSKKEVDKDAIFHEYNHLMNEVCYHRERATKGMIYCTTVFLILVGVAIKEEIMLPFILAWGFVLCSWRRYSATNDVTCRLTSYIMVFLEGNCEHLNWIFRVRDSNLFHRSKNNFYEEKSFKLSRLMSNYFLMSLACIFGMTYFFLKNHLKVENFFSFYIVIIILLELLLNYIILIKIYPYESYQEIREKWERYWTEYKDHLEKEDEKNLGENSI